MRRLRDYIQGSPSLWVTCLLPALFFTLSMQLHIHAHTNHQHISAALQHPHQTKLHKAHQENTHTAEHASELHHAETDAFAIDISPKGLNKSFSLPLFACAFIGIVILLLSPQTQGLVLIRPERRSPHVRRRAALPPQLRAPPF